MSENYYFRTDLFWQILLVDFFQLSAFIFIIWKIPVFESLSLPNVKIYRLFSEKESLQLTDTWELKSTFMFWCLRRRREEVWEKAKTCQKKTTRGAGRKGKAWFSICRENYLGYLKFRSVAFFDTMLRLFLLLKSKFMI